MQLDSLRFPWKLVFCQLQYSLHFHHFVPNSIKAKCLSTKVWAQAYLRPNAQKVTQGVFFVSDRGQGNTCTSLVIASTTGSPTRTRLSSNLEAAWVWAYPGQSWAPRQNVDSLWLRQNSKKSILLMLIDRSDWFWTDQSVNYCCPMIVEKPGQLHRFPSTEWLSILRWLTGWLIINSSHSTNQLQCDCQEFSLRCCVCVID